jgi:acyl carrier protein
MQDIAAKVKQLMVDKLGVEESQLNDNATFKDDLNSDSLDVLELHMELEKTFKIEIPDEDAEKLVTVGSVIKYIIDRKK